MFADFLDDFRLRLRECLRSHCYTSQCHLPATDHTKVISHVFLSTISEQWHNTHWTRLEVLRGLGAVSLRLRSVVTCESVHVITCCMLPYIHYCVFTVIEITVIY